MEASKQEKTDNELIAEFMKLDKHPNNQRAYWIEDQDCYLTFDNLQFHHSWNQLMPVVEKISLMKWEFETERVDHEAESNDDGSLPIIRTKEYDFHYPRTFGMIERDTKQFMFRFNPGSLFIEDRLIDAAYKAVVEFIKFYNSQKPLPL